MIEITIFTEQNKVKYRPAYLNSDNTYRTTLNITPVRVFQGSLPEPFSKDVEAVTHGAVRTYPLEIIKEGIYKYSYNDGCKERNGTFFAGQKHKLESFKKSNLFLRKMKKIKLVFPLSLKEDDIKLEFSGSDPVSVPVCVSGKECSFRINRNVYANLVFGDEIEQMVEIPGSVRKI